MEYLRYGSFRFGDYRISWVGIVLLITFSIVSCFFDLPLLFAFFPITYAAVWLWLILAPNRERFSLHNDVITAKRGINEYIISIPSEVTLVISYTDICPPLAKRKPVGNETHILKDKYSISILHKTPLDITLDCLHKNHLHKYTTSTIQTVFEGHRFVYSFVYDRPLLDTLLKGKNYSLIIPESLLEKVPITLNPAHTYIDIGY